MGAATSRAADVMMSCCSNSLRLTPSPMVEFVKKLANAKSPAQFVEGSTDHARRHFEMLVEQTKQLVALAQQVSLAAAEPSRGLAKADRAA